MRKVAVNDFVLRQVKGSGKTYSEHLSFDEIVIDAERQMAKGLMKEGYRDGVIIFPKWPKAIITNRLNSI